MSTIDYLIIGSGLSSLSFAALMAQSGKRVKIIEAHEYFGGYGHTFEEGPYKFNAHLHYVVGCGEGETLDIFLKKLNLNQKIEFVTLNSEGYDRVYCENKKLLIPFTLEALEKNMLALYPGSKQSIKKFMDILYTFRSASSVFPRHFNQSWKIIPQLPSYISLFKYRNATLQEVFDKCGLPLILQTLVSGQLLDYLAPPKKLSFLIWAALFNAYCRGAYYPKKHFSYFVESLVKKIQDNHGELIPNCRAVGFTKEGKTITGVEVRQVDPKTGEIFGPTETLSAKTIICNMDPKTAANMIGIENFSPKIQKKLDYDYSGSSFVFYGAVKDIDLKDYGFGSWNIWHCQRDHNQTFKRMLEDNDYSKPYFAMNSCSLHTDDNSNCTKENHQIFQMLAPADYDYWHHLKQTDKKEYLKRKKEVLGQLLDIVEEKYVPNIRDHIAFKMTGTPVTNERFVLAPKGGAYGVNLTPHNFSFANKLTYETSFDNFYFCSAASGVGGFSGSILTGLSLYETLTKDYLN